MFIISQLCGCENPAKAVTPCSHWVSRPIPLSRKAILYSLVLFHVIVLPAGFKAFELLDKEVLQNFGTLVEG